LGLPVHVIVVSESLIILRIIPLSQQVQQHSAIPTLVLAPLLFTWMVLTAVALNIISLTAHTAPLQTAPMARLLE